VPISVALGPLLSVWRRLGRTSPGAGMTFSKRLASLFIPYVVAQLIGAIVAALLLYAIAKGHPGFDLAGGFATNGYGDDRRSMRHMKFLQAEARWWISPLVI
jgi:hypothetical protein